MKGRAGQGDLEDGAATSRVPLPLKRLHDKKMISVLKK
jgi:hypothetical protein